jgi:hypothetical protein
VRRWKLGRRLDCTRELEQMRHDLKASLAGFGPEQVEGHLRKMARELGLSADQVQTMAAEAQANQQELRASLDAPDWLEQMGAVRGSEAAVRIHFSADGRLLLCGTDHGARVYEWEKFLTLPETPEAEPPPRSRKSRSRIRREFAPRPLFAVDGESYREEGEEEHHDAFDPHRYVYATAYDAAGERFLYGGHGGVIGCLDLRTGAARTLAELPGRSTIMELALSRDGSALACITQPQFFRNSPKLAPELCVWNYRALVDGS